MDQVVENGQMCWVDLSAVDLDTAVEFYGNLFGWTMTTSESPMGHYVVGSVGDREVAGMMAQPTDSAGSPSMWTTFFFVDDLDDTITKIVSAGGRLLAEPFEIPGGARVSVVADHGGAMFALISVQLQPGPYLSTVIGAVSWVELMTRHPDEAMAFYRDVFGWAATTEDTGGTAYTVFSLGVTQVAGMIPTPADVADDVPDNWSVYFTTADCAATVERAVGLGGQVILPPRATPVGMFAVLADPQGAVFQVMEYEVVQPPASP